MSSNCQNSSLLNRNGLAKEQRWNHALDPEQLLLQDFDLEKWMEYAYHLAKEINFFEINDAQNPTGTWERFFLQKSEIVAFIDTLGDQKTEPMLALFVCFIYLLEIPQKSFNGLTKKHLDYYYKEVLQIQGKSFVADKVYVLFELAKNMETALIVPSTAIDGGKDGKGLLRTYLNTQEFYPNQAQVSELKNFYHHRAEGTGQFKASTVANSADGLGTPLDDSGKWWPFGHVGQSTELPHAQLGFAVSSAVLRMAEGERNIGIEIVFDNTLASFTFEEISNAITVFISSEKGWLGPLRLAQNAQSFQTAIDGNTLNLALNIDKTQKAIVDYNPLLHGQAFETSAPVMRFLFDFDQNPTAYNLYTSFYEHTINDVLVHVDVNDISGVQLENDLGTLKAKKPFLPFGPIPVKRSNFFINYPEAFQKSWKEVKIDLEWKNTPDSFREHYFAYRKEHLGSISQSSYKTAIQSSFNNYQYFFEEFQKGLTAEQSENLNLIVTNDSHFKAAFGINKEETWQETSQVVLFEQNATTKIYSKSYTTQNIGNQYFPEKSGPLRISLEQPFYHAIYPKIYTLAILGEEADDIPNEAYTPMIDHLTLSYTASASLNDPVHNHEGSRAMFFHEHAFGQATASSTLVPVYCGGGELYIGLEKTKVGEQVSLLIQVSPGTENPLSDGFEVNERINWAILAQNEWLPLGSDHIVEDSTGNFLKSGLFKFNIPAAATDQNSLLPAGKFWLKATLQKPFDNVSMALGIHAQACLAQFENQDNELSHLQFGLPASSISKLVNRVSTVKKLHQPYTSFEGQPAESDQAYYQRVSERLRHKNRAITLWDYEHLILEQFPKAHKVKCLNHTSVDSFNAPGNVTLVVIPEIANQNIFDIYKPRLSKGELADIKAYIQKLNSLHVNTFVVSPDYEEVKVSLAVKFYPGFDLNAYKKILADDITKLLSPWAFEETAAIDFGVALHSSFVVHYLENLPYVDFVKDLVLFWKKESDPDFVPVKKASPSSPKSILVSSKLHDINVLETSCGNAITPLNLTPCLS